MQPGMGPFPVLVLGLWGKNNMLYAAYHGMSPVFPDHLPVSSIMSKEPRKAGYLLARVLSPHNCQHYGIPQFIADVQAKTQSVFTCALQAV